MEHKHKYDSQGKQLCCTQTQKIYQNAGAEKLIQYPTDTADQTDDHHDHDHEHESVTGHDEYGKLKMFLPPAISVFILITGLTLDNFIKPTWFTSHIRLLWYLIGYLPVGFPVLKSAIEAMRKAEIFSEFFLMGIATIGAFVIGEYPEGVAVMTFYAIGEVFQTLAIRRAKANIKSLLDQRPDEVSILKDNSRIIIKAEEVNIGDILQLKPGETLALDGELISEKASFNTSALTGESLPETKTKGQTVFAGIVNLNTTTLVRVTSNYQNSKLSKILDLVQNASLQKAPTELFIRKFAKIYTPFVVIIAIAITIIPFFLDSRYVFNEWFYRALVFLVISCPCALVLSIPLAYFGGVGSAGKNGILFKGGNFLDRIANVQHVVMDKTGTLTEGVFKVQEIALGPEWNKEEILQLVNALESHSTHPVATAIHDYVGKIDHGIRLENVEEIGGYGLKAVFQNKDFLCGNFKLMDKNNIQYDIDPATILHTSIAIALDKKFVGYITIADSLKSDAKMTAERLKSMNIKITLLSGDKNTIVQKIAEQLGIKNAFGELLPEDKVEKLKEIKSQYQSVAFVGDGFNDTPVLAISDIGIAMGDKGSDAAIETADVVIQDDHPSKILTAILIGKKTKRIVWQNIALAFLVKAIVLVLGAGGLATMWEAVFADVGVSLIAILNATKIFYTKYDLSN